MNQTYNLEDRTLMFSTNLIAILKRIPLTELNRNIVKQLLRSSTSVGANYREANGASSKKDFRNKIFLCKKEIKESHYWIVLLIEIEKEYSDQLKSIEKESQQLMFIFSKIASTLSQKKNLT